MRPPRDVQSIAAAHLQHEALGRRRDGSRWTADTGQRIAGGAHGTVLRSKLQLCSTQPMTEDRFGRVRRGSHDAESRHGMQQHTTHGKQGWPVADIAIAVEDHLAGSVGTYLGM